MTYLRSYFCRYDDLDEDSKLTLYNDIYSILPAFRKDKIDAINAAGAKLQSAAAFGLLMYALTDLQNDGVVIMPYQISDGAKLWDYLNMQVTEDKKPVFAGPANLFFSISHTDGAVMCAVSDAVVGCDVEHIRHTPDRNLQLGHRFFHEDEIRMLDENPDISTLFTHIWTMKESYIKCTGLGMKQPLNEFNVYDRTINTEVTTQVEEYIGAVCTGDGDYDISAHQTAIVRLEKIACLR